MIHCAVCDSKIYPVLAYRGIGKKREDGRAHACISACFGEALYCTKIKLWAHEHPCNW